MSVDPAHVRIERAGAFGLTAAGEDQAPPPPWPSIPGKAPRSSWRHGRASCSLPDRRPSRPPPSASLASFRPSSTVRTPYRPKVSRRLRPLALRYCTRKDLAPLALTRSPNPGSSSSQRNSSPLAALAASTTLLVSFGISGKHRVSSEPENRGNFGKRPLPSNQAGFSLQLEPGNSKGFWVSSA